MQLNAEQAPSPWHAVAALRVIERGATTPPTAPGHLLIVAADTVSALVRQTPALALFLTASGSLHIVMDALAGELRLALGSHTDLTLACALATTLVASLDALPGGVPEQRQHVTRLAQHLVYTSSIQRLADLWTSTSGYDVEVQRQVAPRFLQLLRALADG